VKSEKYPVTQNTMKTIFKILIALFFTGTISNASARDEYTKVIKKEFTVERT